MFRHRFIVITLLLLAASLALAACGAASPKDDAAISTAVEATLTAVAAQAGEDAPAVTPSPKSSVEPPAAQPGVVLPPIVNGFDPAPRPASSKGDPNAPVVIYEWSDYT